MKISLNWLKQYLATDLSPVEIAEILTSIGLEEEGMEEIESIKGGLEGLVIGEVEECGRHPNADRLSVTKVNVGNSYALHIVCGAPNVAKGQKVVVATVGTTLYDKEGKPFEIKKGKIRGEVSEGMICAEDEIGLSDDHAGIIVLPETVAVGTLAKEYYQVEKDTVFEIGLTPNRSDATSHLGVARDLAAALQINKGLNLALQVPSVDAFQVENTELPISVTVDNLEACPRYSGVSLTNIQVGESPDWLKNRLKAVGVRPINNIVDITNFVLHETGQPLHAFDADQITGGRIIVRTLPEGTKFITLDEEERTLSGEDLMICDGDAKGMCIGGVFGGISSGVTEKTARIFLESAHFDARWIRRTSTRHDLRTDAATRFEKGSDPNGTIYALKRAALLMQELAGATISSEVVDIYPEKIERKVIEVAYAKVNRLIGKTISPTEVKDILRAMDMEILREDEKGFRVAVPTDKSDVLREVDIIEEILRIYGFNRVEEPGYIKAAVVTSAQPDKQQINNMIADLLASNGFAEIMGLSLTQSAYFEKIPLVENSQLVFVNNTSNIQLDVMRPTMLINGLETILRNQNRQQADLRLFELGNTYTQADDDFAEQAHLTLLLTGQRWPESWLNTDKAAVSYYTLKAFVEMILQRLNLSTYQQSPLETNSVWSYGMQYHRGPQVLVEFGQVQNTVLREMDIKRPVFYADFNWDTIIKALRKHRIDFVELNKYPSVRRDLALVIEKSIKFGDVEAIARKAGKKILKDITLFDVYENEEQLGKGKKSYAIALVFEDPTKTLKDKEVEKVMSQLISNCEEQLGALIRK